MDSLNLCWRGQPRSGKRTQVHKALQQLATLRGLPFSLQTKQFYMQGIGKQDNGQITTTVEDEAADEGGSEKDSFPYEYSLLHIGFDIARMSMQDKIYLKPILQRWGAGSQVLAGNQGRGSRILVFYHAHLFSTESYFLLHSLLENNFGDISLWFTSELPVAERLSDYFIEIPVAKALETVEPVLPSWHMFFRKLFISWAQKPRPILSETNEIRMMLYELLMRNLRWTDCVHYCLDVVLTLDIDMNRKKRILEILADQEATSAGQTIPSYRIPLLWENFFLRIREVISNPKVDGESSDSSDPGSTRTGAKTATQMVKRQSNPRRRKDVPSTGS